MISKALNIPVGEIMRHPPVTIPPSESTASLSYMLVKENIGAVIVEDQGRAVGMITEKDVLDRVITKDKNMYQTRAKDIMSKPIISIEADRPIKQALELMRKNNIRRLAVIKNEALVGIVTERRLLTRIVSEHV